MSARGFLAIFIGYILTSFVLYYISIAFRPDSSYILLLLHIAHISIGANGIIQSVELGLKYGWKS